MSILRTLATINRRDFGDWRVNSINARSKGGLSSSGVYVTEDQALRYHAVFRSVGLISGTIAGLPTGVFIGTGAERRPAPAPAWMATPDAINLWSVWMQANLVSKLLRGNTYGLILGYDAQGNPTSIDTQHPDDVVPMRDADGPKYRIAGVEAEQRRYPLGDVVHIPGMTLPGRASWLGLSPISYARQMLGTAIAAEDYGGNFYRDNAVPESVLVTANEMEVTEARRLKREWQRSRANRSREIGILSGGVSIEQLSVSPEDAQFLEAVRAHDKQIYGYFGVPLHMVGLSDMQSNWGTGLEENALQFISYTLGEHITRFEEFFTSLLPGPTYFKFNVAGLLRGRLLDRYAAYITGRQGGWLSIDDIRALEDMPPLPEDKGTDYLQALNFSAIPPGGAIADLPPPPAS